MPLSLDENAAGIWRFSIVQISLICTRAQIIMNYEEHQYNEINVR